MYVCMYRNECLVVSQNVTHQFHGSSRNVQNYALDTHLEKPVNHSIHFTPPADETYAGQKAVDGVYDPAEVGEGIYFSVTTLLAPDPWMVIDLESAHCVEGVKIWPRTLIQVVCE